MLNARGLGRKEQELGVQRSRKEILLRSTDYSSAKELRLFVAFDFSIFRQCDHSVLDAADVSRHMPRYFYVPALPLRLTEIISAF
jgi:hypothetical protein